MSLKIGKLLIIDIETLSPDPAESDIWHWKNSKLEALLSSNQVQQQTVLILI